MPKHGAAAHWKHREVRMIDLKPCPFCGGSAEQLELDDEANFGGSVICCQKCGASSPVHFGRKENLYDSWNRRTEAKQDDKPVAWRVTYASGEVVFLSDKPVGDSGVYECEPLFARPVSPAGRWSDYFDNIRDAIDGCQDADWDSEQAAKSVIRTLDYLNLAPPRTGAVKVKPLDLSNLLRHAFFEGFMIAGGSQEAAAEWWPEYDPETCPAYSRILSTLEPAPEAQQESVVVSVADINTWRAEWMDANDPQDGTDCVTPFDKYLYTRPTHGRRR